MNQNRIENVEQFSDFLMILHLFACLFYIVLSVTYKVWQNTNELSFAWQDQ